MDINPKSIEEYADRVVYRYDGGRYNQALTAWTSVFTTGLKTLVNTDTSRSYIVPKIGIAARFFKITFDFFVSVNVTETTVGVCLAKTSFFRVSIPSLNFDGKSQLTDFYNEKAEQFIASGQLRAINIGDIQVEPVTEFSNLQFTSLSGIAFSFGAATTGLTAIVQPTVTHYKK